MQNLNISAALPEILLLIAACAVLLADVLKRGVWGLDIGRTALIVLILPVLAILAQLNRSEGLTIVLVTHEPEVAMQASRLVRLKDGRVAYDGRPGAEDQT